MNTLVPLEYYSIIYFQFLLIIVLAVFFNSFQKELTDLDSLRNKNSFGVSVLILLILYLGLRPISFAFGDNIEFQKYVNGAPFDSKRDFIFELMKYLFAKYLNAPSFFFTCSFLYVYLLYLASKKMFKDYWFYAFLMFIVAFTFWAYGTNGIRNGLATSIFIYGISRDKKYVVIAFLIASYFIHKGMLIPLLAFLITTFYTNSKVYLYSWFLAIPLSLALGGFWEAFFLSLGFGEEKLGTYLGSFNQASEGVELVAGFRWDFLLYSASGVFAGWYFIYKKGFEDVLYKKIFNTYLIANALWVLVIRANYSNRFAFLSWFLLGLVLIYPLLKIKVFNKQHVVIARIIFVFFGFCYLMNVILKK
jgi:hypothetical protein